MWSLQEKTGWTHRYILWGESWLNIQLKLMDAPRIVTRTKKALETEEDIIDFLNANE